MASLNFDAAPKKNGPLISKTSTPSGISLVEIEFGSFVSSSSFNSRVIIPILVTSDILRINNNTARTIPTCIAIVKSKITVRKNVVSKTIISLLGLVRRFLNERHSLILYETTTRIAAREAIGIRFASLPKKRRISKSTIE